MRPQRSRGEFYAATCFQHNTKHKMSPIVTWISYKIAYLRNIPVWGLHNAPCKLQQHNRTNRHNRRTEQYGGRKWTPTEVTPTRFRLTFKSSLRLVAAHRRRDNEIRKYRIKVISPHSATRNPTRISPMTSFRSGGVCAGCYFKHLQGGALLSDIIIIWHDNVTRI